MKDLLPYRERIADEVRKILPNFLEPYRTINSFAEILEDRLEDYALRGKLIRGSLVPFTYERITAEPASQTVFQFAAILELFQSMLLIHDDIMDQDDMRRGKPSIHAVYREDLDEGEPAVRNHYGVSQGICAGDVVTFAAFGALSESDCDPKLLLQATSFISREMVLVGLAQMRDVYHGVCLPGQLSYSDITDMYRFKTGRYTFSLPMSLGAMLAGGSQELRNLLEAWGEDLGVIFQIKDDELGLYGESEFTGKPKAGDLDEGKVTVFMKELYDAGEPEDRAFLDDVLSGGANTTQKEQVFSLLDRYDTRRRVHARLEPVAERCRQGLKNISSEAPDLSAALGEFLSYNLERVR